MDENPGDCTDAWLRIRHSKLPLRAALNLVRHFGGARELLQTAAAKNDPVLPTGVAQALRACKEKAVQNDLTWLRLKRSHHIITCLDHRYPVCLGELADCPLLLYVNGDPSILNSLQLSVVGSRNPTPTGRELAFRFSANLARQGFTITSGLAIGIDGCAHRGALSVPAPTIAVMATGLDRTYPFLHKKLAEQISGCGALVSEMPTGTPPKRRAFPHRNRIISGLGVGTVVVEATEKSGSLITARLAGEQGREVFAVPGSIFSLQSRGCHALLRDGACLVECEQDILTELRCFSQPTATARKLQPLSAEFQDLLKFMGYDPVTMDVLVSRSGLTADQVCSMLSRMELLGVVKAVLGGHYIRVT